MQSFYKFVKIKVKKETIYNLVGIYNLLSLYLSVSPIIAQFNSECNSVVGKFEKYGISQMVQVVLSKILIKKK